MMQYPGKAITDQYPSRSLCGKRLDNNRAFGSSFNGHPTTCFEDTVLVPLASWLFLAGLVALIAYGMTAGRRSSSDARRGVVHSLTHRKTGPRYQSAGLLNKQDNGRARWPQRHHRLASTLSVLYSLLVVATLLMNVLEIARLYLADRGAGLLPFTLASIVLVLVLMHIPLPRHMVVPTNALILFFWILSLAFTSVQLATMRSLRFVEPRLATEYLDSDQIIDLATIVGLYGLEVVVESVRLLLTLGARKGMHDDDVDSQQGPNMYKA